MRRLPVLAVALATLAVAPAAHAAGGLLAAYETYVPGSGFQVRVVNVSTGAQVSLPSGVNTSADEVHPTLSHDGRYLVFMRTTLVPTLSGDIVPPAARSLQILDRSTGALTELFPASSSKAGASFTVTAAPASPRLSYGRNPWGSQVISFCCELRYASFVSDFSGGGLGTQNLVFTRFDPAGPVAGAVTTHAMSDTVTDFSQSILENRTALAQYLTIAELDPGTGAPLSSVAHLTTVRFGAGANTVDGQTRNFGDAASPAAHPAQRPADNVVAFGQGAGAASDVKTLTFPAPTTAAGTPVAAPSPITTADAERMPAWSPDSLRLGFIRHTGGRRKLGVFDLTPGIQAPLNTPVDLGVEAPTPQLRAYQDVWGGLSLSAAPATSGTAPAITCDATCISRLAGATATPTLSPKSTSVGGGLAIGIFVVKVTGKRTVLGVKLPRIKPIGRVPLGKLRNGRSAFKWPVKVDGKRLKRGTYLLTFRSLRGKRILSTSDSVRFKVGRDGNVKSAKRQRSPFT